MNARYIATLSTSLAALSMLLSACAGNHTMPASPQSSITGGAVNARVPNNTQIPKKNALASTKYITVPEYVYFGNPSPQPLTVVAANGGKLYVTSDNPGVATVSPASQTSKAAPGNLAGKFTATFTVTPVSAGLANITVKDALGNTAVSIADVLSRAYVGTWAVNKPMPTGRYLLGAAAINGILYAVGGYNYDPYYGNNVALSAVEAYNPQTDTWTEKAPMPTARGDLAVAAVNGILYAIGGSGDSGELATVEAYDPSTNSWTAKTSLPAPRTTGGVAVVNGVLYAVGGVGQGMFSETLAYNPDKNKWKEKAAMPTPVFNPAVTAVNNDIYVFGGTNDTGGVTWTVQVYHTLTNTWTSIPDAYPLVDEDNVAVTINGVCYIVGGTANYLSEDAAYYPETNTIKEIAGMLVSQPGLAAAVIQNRLYAVGSRNEPYNTLQVYTP